MSRRSYAHCAQKKTPQNGTDCDAAAVEVYFKTHFNKQVASLIHFCKITTKPKRNQLKPPKMRISEALRYIVSYYSDLDVVNSSGRPAGTFPTLAMLD